MTNGPCSSVFEGSIGRAVASSRRNAVRERGGTLRRIRLGAVAGESGNDMLRRLPACLLWTIDAAARLTLVRGRLHFARSPKRAAAASASRIVRSARRLTMDRGFKRRYRRPGWAARAASRSVSHSRR